MGYDRTHDGIGIQWGCRKSRVDDCIALDIQEINRAGVMEAESPLCMISWEWPIGGDPFHAFLIRQRLENETRIHLFHGNPVCGHSIHEQITLTRTGPHFGGNLWWFLCPMEREGAPCGRRVRKLFLPPAGRHFGCRECHDLAYISSQLSHTRLESYGKQIREMNRMLRGMGMGRASSGVVHIEQLDPANLLR